MLLKRHIHAERVGLWKEHLAEVEKMLLLYPVANGHCNYVSCLPHYQESLPRSDDMPAYTRSDHIEGIQYGHIAVRQTEAQFNGVWRDMTLEKTCNRDTKTKSFTGIILQSAASSHGEIQRVLPVLTAESEQTKAMTHLYLDDTKYHEVTNRQAGKRV